MLAPNANASEVLLPGDVGAGVGVGDEGSACPGLPEGDGTGLLEGVGDIGGEGGGVTEGAGDPIGVGVDTGGVVGGVETGGGDEVVGGDAGGGVVGGAETGGGDEVVGGDAGGGVVGGAETGGGDEVVGGDDGGGVVVAVGGLAADIGGCEEGACAVHVAKRASSTLRANVVRE
eukprot:TRINITY_DN2047_c0_g1_i2.p2 TRINITY_DN2047_c0_g1~~TRINITY_DN2047_c0_g1_i2.p2  ORF type:complete len:174 (+),score=47.83 TRINITY_DN2047_c0_g1_i2:261-782(+)